MHIITPEVILISKELLQYWQHNILESAFTDVDDDRIKPFGWISQKELQAGQVKDQSLLKKIEGDSKEIFICQHIYRKKVSSNEKGKYAIWLMIPATLTYDGRLRGREDPPFIPRKYLRPSQKGLTISEMDRVTNHWKKYPYQEKMSWSSVLETAEKFFTMYLIQCSPHCICYSTSVSSKLCYLMAAKSQTEVLSIILKVFIKKC